MAEADTGLKLCIEAILSDQDLQTLTDSQGSLGSLLCDHTLQGCLSGTAMITQGKQDRHHQL